MKDNLELHSTEKEELTLSDIQSMDDLSLPGKSYEHYSPERVLGVHYRREEEYVFILERKISLAVLGDYEFLRDTVPEKYVDSLIDYFCSGQDSALEGPGI